MGGHGHCGSSAEPVRSHGTAGRVGPSCVGRAPQLSIGSPCRNGASRPAGISYFMYPRWSTKTCGDRNLLRVRVALWKVDGGPENRTLHTVRDCKRHAPEGADRSEDQVRFQYGVATTVLYIRRRAVGKIPSPHASC